MLKHLLAAGALLAAVAPAWAANEYYIVRGAPDGDCTVVEERPANATIVGGTGYGTRSEAQAAIKEVCKDEDDEDND
jgi:hypothetical protein